MKSLQIQFNNANLLQRQQNYKKQKCFTNSWIKLQQVSTQSYPTLERLKRTLEQNQQQQSNQQKPIHNHAQSSSYISPIFSLEKAWKKYEKGYGTNIKRLLYHNYVKYKTIPFTYDKIFMPKEYPSNFVNELTERIYQSVVDKCQNICFLGFGTKQSEINHFLQGSNSNQGIFYSTLVKINDLIREFNKSSQKVIEFTVNFLAISENKVFDLMDLNNDIFVKQDPNQKNSIFSLPLIFQSAIQYHFQSNYQLYTTFKKINFRRKQLKSWNIFTIQINFQQSNSLKKKISFRKVVLVEWIKENSNLFSDNKVGQAKNSQGKKSLLCLNQCILEIFKIIEVRINGKKLHSQSQQEKKQGQQIVDINNQYTKDQIIQMANLQVFRNSLITRILKPYLRIYLEYLVFNSSVIFTGFCSINQQHQNESYQTLMLGRHISKLHTLKQTRRLEKFSNIMPANNLGSIQVSSQEQQDYGQNSIEQNNTKRLNEKKLSEETSNRKKIIKSQKQSLLNSKLQSKDKNQEKSLKQSPIKKQEKIRAKLVTLLDQARQKQKSQNAENYQFNQLSKKIFEEKVKSLKAKKQLNLIKIKAQTKALRCKIANQSENNDKEKIDQELKRLSFDDKKSERQIQKLGEQLTNKIFKISNSNLEDQYSLKNRKIQIQKLQHLKNHFQNQLNLNQMEINEFLEEKQSIKSLLIHQISLVKKQEKQLLKKLQNIDIGKKIKIFQQVSNERNSLPKMRLIRQMQPRKRSIFSSQFTKNAYNNNYGKKLTLEVSRFNTRQDSSYTSSRIKSNQNSGQNQFQKEAKAPRNKNRRYQNIDQVSQIQVDKIKKERQIIKRKQALQNKLKKGRAQYSNFLENAVKRYISYSPQRRQSTK